MKKVLCTVLLIIGWLSVGELPRSSAAQPVYEFRNGRWFDGEKFVARNFYTVRGLLTTRKPPRVDRVIDLNGRYVVPPFGEAHNHNLEESAIQRYLAAGIFYVKNPNALPRDQQQVRGRINLPTSVDAVLAHGGLTATGGHPLGVVKRNLDRKIWTEAEGDGAFVVLVDTLADLDRKWPQLLARQPDFIKTYLLYSEEYAKRKDEEKYFAWKGLNPALLPEIVKRAHRAGLRVSTHVESAADFHQAVQTGVDEINHLPGFRPDRNNPQNYAEPDAEIHLMMGFLIGTGIGALVGVGWGASKRKEVLIYQAK